MSGYDGSGNFSWPYNWVNDAANGIPITASRFDTQFDTASTGGFDLVITRDGQGVPTANIPWGGFKITNLASGTAASDAATVAQVQVAPLSYCIAAGTVDAITGAFTPTVTALVDGMELDFEASGANTSTTPTFKADGTTAKIIVKSNNIALVAGDISGVDFAAKVRYSSALDRWVLLNPVFPSLSVPTWNVGGSTLEGTLSVNRATIGEIFSLKANGTTILYSGDASQTYASGESATNSVLFVRKDNSTGRSISAAGTINASGADYAEYETKAPGCGLIAKGQVVGFDVNGKLTDKWSGAISFGVKSTNPNLVGGDGWSSPEALGIERPRQPAEITRADDESADDWVSRQADYTDAVAAYTAAKAAFDAALEAARQTVDRIAYAGKAPVNVTGATVGDYICAAPDGDGIKGFAIASPSFDQYRVAVGRVRRVLPDGRAEISVCHN